MTETSDTSFPKSLRLLNASDYSDVFGSVDFKLSTKYFLCLTRNTGRTEPRLGLIVAKKNVRLAVNRNRLKRIVRENFRHSTRALPNLDIVVLVKKEAQAAEHSLLNKELQYIWRKLKQRAKS